MENIKTIPTNILKQAKLPEYVDENRMTEDELCDELLESLDAIERGEVYTMEEVEAELTRLYGIKF